MEISLAIIGLLFSFFFAGSEAAYMAFNNLRLEVWERNNRPFAKTARRFTERPENFYSTILLGNNVSNVTYSSFATILLIPYMNDTLAWFIITLIVLFFGEIFPKVLFQAYANRIVLNVLMLIKMVYLFSYPIIKTINKIISMVYGLLGVRENSFNMLYSREELRLILEEETEPSDQHRQRYIMNILEFSSAKVSEAMTPRTEIIAVPQDTSWEDLLDIMTESGKLHIPVYKENLDDIVGLVFIFDMFEPFSAIDTVIKPIQYVPETKNCSELLNELQTTNSTVAVVIDEYGGTEGLVTTDDLVEVVFGEFLELHEEAPVVKAMNDKTWLIDARIDLEELENQIGLTFPEGDYETLAGFIINELGHIPPKNTLLEHDAFRIKIIDASAKRVKKVKLIRNTSE